MLTYKDSGIDLEKGKAFVSMLQRRCPQIGGFNGCFPLGNQYLVGATDGVGTKLQLAVQSESYRGIGIDLVAMCVNDLATCGAKPLFFMDYISTSSLNLSVGEELVGGIIDACEAVDCQLLGGETAEMPGLYQDGEYDVCGFSVGIVDKASYVDGSTIQEGDLLVGLASSGCHSNGYSLIRRLIKEDLLSTTDQVAGEDCSLMELLLTPTRLYVEPLQELFGLFKGAAHITGGGFIGNIPRMLPRGLGCCINSRSWSVPAEFRWIQRAGHLDLEEMFGTFNMGIGMVLAMAPDFAERTLEQRQDASIIGYVEKGEGVRWESI